MYEVVPAGADLRITDVKSVERLYRHTRALQPPTGVITPRGSLNHVDVSWCLWGRKLLFSHN